MTSKKLKPFIICGGSQGRAVIFGWTEQMPQIEKPCILQNARMVLYWPTECGGLLGLAANGPKPGLRLTGTVDFVSDTPRQCLSVNKKAAEDIRVWMEETPNAQT